MALSYNELSATTQNFFIQQMVDNIFTSNTLLMRLKKKGYKKFTGGLHLIQPVLYATTTAVQWYSGTDTINTAANDQFTAAQLDLASIVAAITITHSEELTNAGKAQEIDMIRSKIQVAEMSLSDTIGTGLYNLGTDSKAIIGLRLAVDSTGTYAGVSRASYAWWAAQEDSTTTVITLAAIQALIGDCTVGADRPTLLTTTQDIFDDIVGLIQPVQRFTDEESANAGFRNIMYAGVPIMVDNHCPASHLFALNEKYMSLYYHPTDDFAFEPFIRPTNQMVATAKIRWSGQLLNQNCRMSGKMNAIA